METPLTFDSLFDNIGKHFNHPIPNVLYPKIRNIGQMIHLPDNELLSIRNFGKKGMAKVNKFRFIYNEAKRNLDTTFFV